jgi:hypothetical protein
LELKILKISRLDELFIMKRYSEIIQGEKMTQSTDYSIQKTLIEYFPCARHVNRSWRNNDE